MKGGAIKVCRGRGCWFGALCRRFSTVLSRSDDAASWPMHSAEMKMLLIIRGCGIDASKAMPVASSMLFIAESIQASANGVISPGTNFASCLPVTLILQYELSTTSDKHTTSHTSGLCVTEFATSSIACLEFCKLYP